MLIGEVGHGAWRDMHLTPVGMMEGVLVHANALLTPASHTVEIEQPWWYAGSLALIATVTTVACFIIEYRVQTRLSRLPQRWWQRGFLGVLLFIAFAAFALLATFLTVAGGSAIISRHWDRDWTEAIKLAMEIGGVVFTALLFAGYFVIIERFRPRGRANVVLAALFAAVAFMANAGFCIVCLGVIWIALGNELLPMGLKIGSLAPAFAAGLEAFVKAGGGVIAALEVSVGRIMAWVSATVVLLMIQVAWAAGGAAEPGGLVVMSVGTGRLEHEATPTALVRNQQIEVTAGDLLILDAGAIAQLRQGVGEPLTYKGPGNFHIQPIPHEPIGSELSRSFSAFYQLVFSPRPGPCV